MDCTRGMCSRWVDMWTGRRVVREVGRDLGSNTASFPGKSAGRKFEVEQDPAAFHDDI